ncbi:MAG: hypothetical protein NT023_09800 [Armatimonadetes bacterium]|nr:hypothetical protein [Armatimonadota bacterium]
MKLRYQITVGLITLCIVGSFGAAKADDTANAKKAIQTIYAKVASAAAKKDVKGMMAHLAPDYEEATLDGVTFKVATIKAKWEHAIQSVKAMKISTTITKLTLSGDKATVLNKATINMVGISPRNDKDVILISEGTSEEQWEKKGGIWLEKRSKNLTLKQTRDGKEVQASSKKFKRP